MSLWQGRFNKELNKIADDFNSSLSFDKRLFQYDIIGSIAHATMLGDTNIISKEESNIIVSELNKMLDEEFDFSGAEDIHTFIEFELTKRLNDLGKKLHTARSRNDQIATDLKLYLRDEIDLIVELVENLIEVLNEKATDDIMPGYTHLQRAQPITFKMHLNAYIEMFNRDISRLKDCKKRMNESPLGCGALAGTKHPIDRIQTATLLGFDKPCNNTLDGVSERDYCIELASVISIIMLHLSRFSEEIILWCSSEFKFIELDDAFSTGSSIMPQKKNPDIAELVRGKSGRTFGNLQTLLIMMKGLPLAYNKDMQEDKQAIFDSIDTVKMSLIAFTPMVETMKILVENMFEACKSGFLNATEVADYLTNKGIPFRDAYMIVGKLVNYCIEVNKTLDELSLEEYKKFSDNFNNDVYREIDIKNSIFLKNI